MLQLSWEHVGSSLCGACSWHHPTGVVFISCLAACFLLCPVGVYSKDTPVSSLVVDQIIWKILKELQG